MCCLLALFRCLNFPARYARGPVARCIDSILAPIIFVYMLFMSYAFLSTIFSDLIEPKLPTSDQVSFAGSLVFHSVLFIVGSYTEYLKALEIIHTIEKEHLLPEPRGNKEIQACIQYIKEVTLDTYDLDKRQFHILECSLEIIQYAKDNDDYLDSVVLKE